VWTRSSGAIDPARNLQHRRRVSQPAPIRPVPAAAPWAEPYLTVGVTGTNGKTSTTMLVASALRAAGHRVVSETTIGYQLDDEALDVPRTRQGFLAALERGARAGCRHAAIEVTSNALGGGFAKRWRFDIGVFTNLTRDHLETHRSWEHYLASKAQLFVHLPPGRSAVLNACDEAALLLERVTPPDVARLWYAVPARGPLLRAADLAARSVEVTLQGTRIALEPSALAERLGGSLATRLIGEVFAENALAAACGAVAAGVEPERARDGIASAPPVPGRFELASSAPAVAVDYAHTPDALARTCATARRLAGAARVIVVFGAGGGFDPGKRAEMGRAVGERADFAIVTTDNPREEDPAQIARALAAGCRRGGRAHVELEPDRRRAIARALERARPDDVVVVAGKGHEAAQTDAGGSRAFSDRDVVAELLAGRSR
jgi:UDP-N-acetylmuramoyl-L-alanyl-D-glutamate--2,6-diaminopimelate ligase